MQEEKICLFPDQKQRASVIAESVPHERDRSSFCISCAGNPSQNRTEADHAVRFAMHEKVQDSNHEMRATRCDSHTQHKWHQKGALKFSNGVAHQYWANLRTKFGQTL